jgi:methyltransferase (TIGR00027 family)
MDKIKPNLDESSETLLISLWSRAQVIEQDTKAKDLLHCIDYDFSRFERWKKQLKYTIARTNIFDNAVVSFLDIHPNAIVINIGAGLDTRFFRMDNGKIVWYEIDLPQVIVLRKQLIQETPRYHFVAASLADERWVKMIREKNRPIIFIVEGVLMYLEESEVKKFFHLVAHHFANAEMICEIAGPFFTKFKHHLIQATDSKPLLHWSIWRVRKLEKIEPRIHICAVFELKEPWSLFFSSKVLGLKIVHLQFVQ